MQSNPNRSEDEANPPQPEGGVGRSIMVYILNEKWYPNPNIYSTMGILAVLAAMFLVLAGMMFAAHKNVVEVIEK
jgi:hypothetical protein